MMKKLELLAPAKNLACGIAAIDHGADAVYIGASRYGARAAAGNSVEDIASLCQYAHQYGAKVYVTVNTIIYDTEIDDTRALIKKLCDIGVDALLVQDMGLLELVRSLKTESKCIPVLHASTQTDNRTVDKVRWLHSLGFQRVVLARELSLDEIRNIHQEVPDIELEVFVHGALCVSYSGQCYASQYCLGRSANRGECAQMCRMKYDLVDADGHVIEHQRHLLSLKDMCRIDYLEQLADAGVVSFKIEGRLKDVDYVKNVVAAYSLRLDEMIHRRSAEYQRASLGKVSYSFTPCLAKTFNRGFTDYFLHSTVDEKGRLQGRRMDIASFDTPKALGEYVGKVKETHRSYFIVAGVASFSNGDGLCFFDGHNELVGFRVNRVEGNHLFPLKMPLGLQSGMALYRNKDVAFEKLMNGETAQRKISIRMALKEVADGFSLTASLMPSLSVSSHLSCEKHLAEKPQRENMYRQLTKLGNTPYLCTGLDFESDVDKFFIPSSRLAELRRDLVRKIDEALAESRNTSPYVEGDSNVKTPLYHLPYLYNVSNRLSRAFYSQRQVKVDEALELRGKQNADKLSHPLLMQCRYCLLFSLGRCKRHDGAASALHEPLYLRLSDGRRFRLQFDCNKCQMNIYAE